MTDQPEPTRAELLDRISTLQAHLSELAEICTDLDWLLLLSRDPSPLIREGAAYGLSRFGADHHPRLHRRAVNRLRELAESDPSPGVRDAAREALP
jgi:hypothetical protein